MKSTAKPQIDSGGEAGDARPSSDAQVGQRLSVVVGLFDTKRSAAKIAKTTPEMLSRYVQGVHRLPFEVAARLADPHGVSLQWLAFGEGPMRLAEGVQAPPPSTAADEALLGNLIEGLESYLIAEDLQLHPRHKARVVVLFRRLLDRRRIRMLTDGSEVPPELSVTGHPINIAADPDLADIVRLAE